MTARLANAAWDGPRPVPHLSVLVPFYNADARPMARALLAQAEAVAAPVEMIFADDASPDPSHGEALAALFAESRVPAQIIRPAHNLGRGGVRNLLGREAGADVFLFMDCDMLPDNDAFLARYLALIAADAGDVIYGGRSVDQIPTPAPAHRLHWAFTKAREQVPATRRNAAPAFHFMSSNFLVRRSVLAACPFHDGYAGWGWEDGEWAARAGAAFRLVHVDNTATHLGLLDAATLLGKYDESVANFLLTVRIRPELVTPSPLYRITSWLAWLRLGGATASLARWLVLMEACPMRLRIAGLLFYKAGIYARVLREALARKPENASTSAGTR